MKPLCTVAVLDTGVLPHYRHPNVLPGLNYNPEARPGDSILAHGTAVCESIRTVAPQAHILPVAVTNKFGQLNTVLLELALQELWETRTRTGLRVICMAFADYSNQQTDTAHAGSKVQKLISALREACILTVAAAGNWRGKFHHEPEGMAWPAILRDVVSAGALDETYGNMPAVYSQRLQAAPSGACATTVFTRPLPPGETSGAAAKTAGVLAGLYLEDPGGTLAGWLQRFQAQITNVTDAQGQCWPVM